MLSPANTRILLIDDDVSFHRFLSGLLDGGEVELVSAMNGSDGLHALKESVFDLVLVDYQLPDMLGLEILEWMRDRRIETPKVFVTGFGTIEVAVKAMKLGAVDLFTKPLGDPPAFVRFLNRILALDPPLGQPDVAPGEREEPADEGVPTDSEAQAPDLTDLSRVRDLCASHDPPVALSRRECEILAQILRGLSNKEIAATLYISDRTVKNHITHIFRKFDVESRPQLFNKIMRDM